MAVNRKIAGTRMTLPGGLLKGALSAVVLTLVGAAVLSWLIVRENLQETSIGYCAMGILVISSYIGARVSMGAVKTKKLVVSLLSGLIYYGILLLVNALCFRSGIEGAVATGLVVLAGVGGALLIRSRPEKRRHASLRKNNRR